MSSRSPALAPGLVLVLLSGWTGRVAAGGDWRDALQPMLRSHCLDCHAGPQAEGGLDLSSLSGDLSDAEVLRRWVQAHDRLAAGEMPPADAPQPTLDDRRAAVTRLEEVLLQADRARRKVVLRRLNRREYQNTVRDLLDVEAELEQLLPRDASADGFDNVGEALAVSAEAAAAYLRAADEALDAAFGPPEPPRYIRHETNLLKQLTWDGKPQLAGQLGKMFRRTERGVVIFQSGYCPTNLVNFARLRAPAGTYRVAIEARAVQSDRPVTLRVYGGDTIVGRREKHLVGYFDIPPQEWTRIEFVDRLVEPGGTFQPKCYGTKDTREDADTYPEPGIEIGDITIEGPLEPWPPPSRRRLLGEIDPETAALEDARAILSRLVPQAFRRPVSPEQLEPFVGLVRAALAEGRGFEAALRVGLKGVLCSPEFLFLEEPLAEGEEVIDHYALAARLSYFLWSAPPDAELLALAADGRIADAAALRQQVERMLQDPKSDELTVNFLGQWLDLREIDFTAPDMNLYPEFDELLRISMVEETHRFFRELLDHDLDLLLLVDSDFAVLNERLARHYGVVGVLGQEFRKVALPAGSVRGGVLTQASVLKVTANGTTTSPVLRGAWILENFLGEPVPPPPGNVPAVEPDIRGATTLREQLARHRDVVTCHNCHRKIDPAGFALENFDVIGGWRERYRTLGEGERPEFSRDPLTFAWIRYRLGAPVDASGVTADGEPFRDIRDFKQVLLNNPRRLIEAATRKLATYALGRRLGFADRGQLAGIADRAAEQGGGLRTLVHEVVQSSLFRQP